METLCCQAVKERNAYLEAEVNKYKTMVDELMYSLATSQEKQRLEHARSDKLMQRIIRLETEKRGQV